MSLVLIVYLIGILPTLSKGLMIISYFVTTFGLFSAVVLICTGSSKQISSYSNKEEVLEERKIQKLWGFRLLKISIFAGFLGLVAGLIPSEKTMYTMVAVYGAEKIAETPAAQQLGNDAFDVLKGLVAKAKKELSDDKEKK